MTESTEQLKKLEEAFSPSAPITVKNFFFGRFDHLKEILDAIRERGQHIVVYGERGVGKTSFANISASSIQGIFPIKITCNRKDVFKKIWDRAFQRVKFEQSKEGMGFIPIERKESVQLDLFLPDKDDISSIDIQFVLEKVQVRLMFIFDEFDTIDSGNVISEMADTIKSLSDNAPHVTIMLVGVGSTISDLIGEHESINRCLRQVKLPRMSNGELKQILDHGLEHMGFSIDATAEREIIRFSQGFPHFTHLLGKNACKACLEDGIEKVGAAELERSISISVERVDESIRNAYQRGTMTSKNSDSFKSVVWACSDAEEDEHGTFKLTDIAAAYSKITKKETKANAIAYHIGKLCSDERGKILDKVGTSNNVRYRFRNPLLRAYIQLKRRTILKLNRRDVKKS